MKIKIVREKEIKPSDIINIDLCYYDEIIDAIKDALTDYFVQIENLDFGEIYDILENMENEDFIGILKEVIKMIEKYGTT